MKERIRRRVKRHLAGQKIHRVTQTDEGIFYRLPGGEMLKIRVDKLGRVYVAL